MERIFVGNDKITVYNIIKNLRVSIKKDRIKGLEKIAAPQILIVKEKIERRNIKTT